MTAPLRKPGARITQFTSPVRAEFLAHDPLSLAPRPSPPDPTETLFGKTRQKDKIIDGQNNSD